MIREQQSGRLNGTTTVPLDVSGQLWKTLTAAQAGYRGERARAWATTLAQKVVVIRAYFDLLAGRSGCAAWSSRTSRSTASSWRTRSSGSTPAG